MKKNKTAALLLGRFIEALRSGTAGGAVGPAATFYLFTPETGDFFLEWTGNEVLLRSEPQAPIIATAVLPSLRKVLDAKRRTRWWQSRDVLAEGNVAVLHQFLALSQTPPPKSAKA